MTLRDWATPLTIGTFALSAVTGVLMFFHLDGPLNKLAHEWLSWALLIGAGAHIFVNFSAFKRHFTRRSGLAVIGVCAVALVGSFAPAPSGGGKPPHVMAAELMLNAPLRLTAQLAGQDVAQMAARLQAAGVAATADQSLAQVAGPSREARMKALGIALATKP